MIDATLYFKSIAQHCLQVHVWQCRLSKPIVVLFNDARGNRASFTLSNFYRSFVATFLKEGDLFTSEFNSKHNTGITLKKSRYIDSAGQAI
ncbi:unnamed protein product, partial [Schistosoma guineensis]